MGTDTTNKYIMKRFCYFIFGFLGLWASLSYGPVLASGERKPLDYILAVVNSEPITNNQVLVAMNIRKQELTSQKSPLQTEKEIRLRVIKELVDELIQVQRAQSLGLSVEEEEIDAVERSNANINRVSLAAFKEMVENLGIKDAEYRLFLRKQMLIGKLIGREVDSLVAVTEREAEEFLIDKSKHINPDKLLINLAQIFVAVPEKSDLKKINALKAKAKQLHLRASKNSSNFDVLARENSDAPDRANGGLLGLRRLKDYPELFAMTAQNLNIGDVSNLLRSGAGFHILKVVDKANSDLPLKSVAQTRARHILLKPGASKSVAEIVQELKEYKEAVNKRGLDFATLAAKYSQDQALDNGGDLGWASPGVFVPEFEEAMNKLKVSEISEPVVSRFGVHLIQVLERRRVMLTRQELIKSVRNMLLADKKEKAYARWLEELVGGSYVEMRELSLFETE